MIPVNDQTANIATLKEIFSQFVQERDWQQFHSPKNLASKMVIEAGELLEKFVWLDSKASFDELEINRQEIEDELADVFIIVLGFCNAAKIDLTSAMLAKLREVKAKYPIDKAKGNYKKYTKL